MKKFLIVVLCALVLLPLMASAQVKKEDDAKEPATKLEAFLAKKGMLVVKDFYSLGKVDGRFASVVFKALVIYEPGREHQRIRGLIVEHDTKTLFLDLEEIESLSKALEYMIDLSAKWKDIKKEYTEVLFSTKDDFSIGFYQKGTQQTAFSSSGYISKVWCFFSSIQDLSYVKAIVDKGLKLLSEK